MKSSRTTKLGPHPTAMLTILTNMAAGVTTEAGS